MATRGEERSSRRLGEVGVVCVLALVAAGLCLTVNLGSEFWWNDAARHAMDGVFVLDFARDLPQSLSLRRYAVAYYARYPCLGLVHYPPVFSVVEALFFAVLGVSVVTARLTVAAFAGVGAVFGYLVARRFIGRLGAAVFVLLFSVAPGVVYWSRGVMLETPVMAMMLVGSHVFLGYVDDERRGFGIAAALLLVAAALTKQTACVLGPVWVAYAAWRRGWRLLRGRESLLAAALVVVLLAPYAIAMVRYAPLNVEQTVGDKTGDFEGSRWGAASALFYLRRVPRHAGMMGLIGMGLLAVVGAVRRLSGRPAFGSPARARGVVYALLWVVACYLAFTFGVANKERRFILIWAPALALLGASGYSLLAEARGWARGVAAAALVVLGGQAAAGLVGWRHDPWALPSPWVGGTRAAARRVAASPAGTVAFYAGNFNGNFIFHVRRFDPGRRVVVLRATKQLFGMKAMQEHGLRVYVRDRADILEVLRDYGVRYLLVEDPTPKLDLVRSPNGRSLVIMDELRALARSSRFRLIQHYPIVAGAPQRARRLSLYEFLEAGPARTEMLTIEIPMAGRRIQVPLRRLGVPTLARRRRSP